MNKSPVTDAVIAHWKEKAGNRQTVVFCSTVDHARNVADAFNAAGVSAAIVHGEMGDVDRKATLAAYDRGEIQVVTNVAVLTEGWDHPPTSCVVLLRPSSYKSTMMQMVGRGLRTVNPEEYPGILKTDCIILDFGTSSLIHGSLEQDVDLNGRQVTGDAPTKTCPSCEAKVPADGSILMASGLDAWAGVFAEDGRCYAVGGAKGKRATLLGVGESLVCIAAADDWLNTNESDEAAHKTKGWLRQQPTDKQLAWLPPACRMDFNLTRYQASAMLSLKFNLTAIRARISEAKGARFAVAA
jgi:hypothetical protein